MCESVIRLGLFLSILNRAPTFLRGVQEDIGQEAIEILTGFAKPRFSANSDLDIRTYEVWLQYVNRDLNGRHGSFKHATDVVGHQPALLTHVQKSIRLKLGGKPYSAASVTEGNSLIGYKIRGKNCFGKIQYFFRSPLISADFLCVQPFAELDEADATKNIYLKHPGLQATILYDTPADCVVVDSQDLISHVAAQRNPANSFGICRKTISVVGLTHAVCSLDWHLPF